MRRDGIPPRATKPNRHRLSTSCEGIACLQRGKASQAFNRFASPRVNLQASIRSTIKGQAALKQLIRTACTRGSARQATGMSEMMNSKTHNFAITARATTTTLLDCYRKRLTVPRVPRWFGMASQRPARNFQCKRQPVVVGEPRILKQFSMYGRVGGEKITNHLSQNGKWVVIFPTRPTKNDSTENCYNHKS